MSECLCVCQVVLGVLGCPNLPQQPIQEEDGAAGVAEKVGTEGIGCLFTAIKGQGAFVKPLYGKSLPLHSTVNDIILANRSLTKLMTKYGNVEQITVAMGNMMVFAILMTTKSQMHS